MDSSSHVKGAARPSSVSNRWFGAGNSTNPDSARAGREAAALAVAGREPAAVFVFCSVAHDLPALLAAVRAEAGDPAVIVGATTVGEISTAGQTDKGVAVAALGGAGFTVRTRVAHFDPERPRDAGVDVAASVAELDQKHTALLLLCDGMAGNPHEIVRGAYSVLGATVPLVGGGAGDDVALTHPFLFHGDNGGVEVLSGAVVGVAIGSDAPLGVGIAHGWRRIDPPMIVTRSLGNRLYELDDEPAMDVLVRRLGIDESEPADVALFGDGTILRPLGLSRRSGEDIRVINSGDVADRSVSSLADVPQGALVWLMESDVDSLVAGAGQSCAEAVAGLGGAPPIGMLAFDCGGRKYRLGEDGVRAELGEIRAVLGDVPFAGLYSVGEIARVRGALGMHHLTLVTLALA
jgi:hypothetical protein